MNTMINAILIFPIIACVIMFFIKNKNFNSILLNISAIAYFMLTVLMIANPKMAGSSHYFGIDAVNSIFLLVLAIVFLMVSFYNLGYVKTMNFPEKKIRNYSMMIIIFVLAMTGTLLSNDLGLSWVLIEATTLSSAYLIYFEKTKHSIEAAWKYVFICSIGISLAFVGIILLNISTGSINTLNFEQLNQHALTFNHSWLKVAFVFMMFGFGAKMGLAPIHFWLPDAHSEAPSPVSALLSAALLNSAFLVIVRIFKVMDMANCVNYARFMLLIMGFLSLFVTAVFLYHIKNYKRMLAYSSIENMGILSIGLALGGAAYYAVILHLIGHSLAKASFFLTSGNVLELYKTKRIKSVNGLIDTDGKTGWLWVISFLAICAFPTSVLFISEFIMIKTMILQGHYAMCVMFVLLLTIILYGMGRVVVKMAFGKISEDKNKIAEINKSKINLFMYVPQFVMLAVVFILGIYVPPFLNSIINSVVASF